MEARRRCWSGNVFRVSDGCTNALVNVNILGPQKDDHSLPPQDSEFYKSEEFSLKPGSSIHPNTYQMQNPPNFNI
jgi:hypothetical protein